jgi:hypothetical protein
MDLAICASPVVDYIDLPDYLAMAAVLGAWWSTI